jgi:hypothetical protein
MRRAKRAQRRMRDAEYHLGFDGPPLVVAGIDERTELDDLFLR